MEKIFKELILSEKDEHASVTVRKCLELMQQVRKATIAECLGALNGYDHDERIKTEFETMKTDRITITDK